MTGWDELAAVVDSAWNSLTPSEKKTAGVFAENYGEAGAIEYHNRDKAIPDPISFSDNFLLWAPDSVRGHTLIYVNYDTTQIRTLFHTVTLVGQIRNPYAREHGLGIWLCRNPVKDFPSFYAKKVQSLKSHYMR